MQRIIRFLGRLYKYTCVVLIALMVLIVFSNTVLRYMFNSGIVENEELLRYMFIWVTFLGITAVYAEGGHISVTMLADKMSEKARAVLALVMDFVVLYALFVFTEGSVMYLLDSETTVGQMTGIPFVYIIAAAVFAGAGCAAIVLRDMWRCFTLSRNGAY